ncbi:MAG: hypothetical protein EOM37_16030 [Proteobacteria bacterium]|nr:hypothetical protein [Pseudomonadota bacterium]
MKRVSGAAPKFKFTMMKSCRSILNNTLRRISWKRHSLLHSRFLTARMAHVSKDVPPKPLTHMRLVNPRAVTLAFQ